MVPSGSVLVVVLVLVLLELVVTGAGGGGGGTAVLLEVEQPKPEPTAAITTEVMRNLLIVITKTLLSMKLTSKTLSEFRAESLGLLELAIVPVREHLQEISELPAFGASRVKVFQECARAQRF